MQAAALSWTEYEDLRKVIEVHTFLTPDIDLGHINVHSVYLAKGIKLQPAVAPPDVCPRPNSTR